MQILSVYQPVFWKITYLDIEINLNTNYFCYENIAFANFIHSIMFQYFRSTGAEPI